MFSALIAYIKEILRTPTYFENLEAYITAGAPKDLADVERLEREFSNRKHRNISVFDRYQ